MPKDSRSRKVRAPKPGRGGAITPKIDWRLYAENAVAPLCRKCSGAFMPEMQWRLYAGNPVASLGRKSAGSFMPKTEWLHIGENSHQDNWDPSGSPFDQLERSNHEGHVRTY
jgi:hypothetical protein